MNPDPDPDRIPHVMSAVLQQDGLFKVLFSNEVVQMRPINCESLVYLKWVNDKLGYILMYSNGHRSYSNNSRKYVFFFEDRLIEYRT